MNARHVVLLTYGEPPTPDFISHLVYSWRILLGLTRRVAAIPAGLLPLIALSRARRRNLTWKAERYGSPLEPITEGEAADLERALAALEPGTAWRVHVAYEFRDPLLPAVLDRLRGEASVDVVPMYVADSAFTHQLSHDVVERWRARGGSGSRRPRGPSHRARSGAAPVVRVLPPMDEEVLAELFAGHVRAELAGRGVAGGPEWALVLAAHGTLLEPPRPMETGREATERIYRGIERRLAGQFGTIAIGWLNHAYGGRWTEPPVEDSLARIAAAGYRRLVYFPFGFLADNAESELEGRVALRGQPGLEALHLPSLNRTPRFMDALARCVAASGRKEVARGREPREAKVSLA